MKNLNEIILPFLRDREVVKTQLMILLGVDSNHADQMIDEVIESHTHDWKTREDKPTND